MSTYQGPSGYNPLPQQAAPRMPGFGSADVIQPTHYGSVNDGRLRNDGLEQKLKKQYWKTKQTLIQKMGKDQDEFVVAGDTDIDKKLEKAYHLRSTSVALLQAITKFTNKIKTCSSEEETMGRYLMTWSETEYTNAGEVMQNVGKMQENDSVARLAVIPALARLQSECAVFQHTAIRDLNFSIDALEKCRTEYRAALLWMKDVSEKLHNPDYHNQLARFREAQVAVKDSKQRFERLRHDLSEKIDMVFASRCNLLSRSLPFYQKELLKYCDTSANAVHKILVDLRSHHHHQYKVKRLLEEIRDLESEETPIAQEIVKNDDDEPLLDIGADLLGVPPELADQAENVAQMQDDSPAPTRSDPFSFEKIIDEAKVNDLTLKGSEAGLELQSASATNGGSSQLPSTSQSNGEQHAPDAPLDSALEDEIDSLLKFDDVEDTTQVEQPKGEDPSADEWGSFSAFMTASSQPAGSQAGWEKVFESPNPPLPSRQDSELNIDTAPQPEKANATTTTETTDNAESAPTEIADLAQTKNADSAPYEPTLLSDDLKDLGLENVKEKEPKQEKISSELEGLDPLMFQNSATQPLVPPQPSLTPTQPEIQSALVPMPGQVPMQFGQIPMQPGQIPIQPGQTSMFRSPLAGSQMPILPPAYFNQVSRGAPTKGLGGTSPKKQVKSKPEAEKGNAWMNVFAHLDPLANEKV